MSTEEVPHGGVLSYASGGGGVHSNAWEEGLAKARQLRKIRCLVCFLSGFVCLFVCFCLSGSCELRVFLRKSCSKKRRLEDLDYDEKKMGFSIAQAEMEEEADNCAVDRQDFHATYLYPLL